MNVEEFERFVEIVNLGCQFNIHPDNDNSAIDLQNLRLRFYAIRKTKSLVSKDCINLMENCTLHLSLIHI